jgi:adenylate cyclase
MASQDFKRKLTAILSADVEGYSRLMGEDEEATVRTITAYREVMTTLIHQHRGKVVDSPGDNVLAEFASVVDAVQCAVAVQKEIDARNTELPENRQMHFRIGINLGDVIQEGDRIYGDGVNIAARLEGLAEPGGICVSKTAFDHIESKLPYGYDFIGDQTVKNISKPVGAYRVLMDPRVTVAGKPKEKLLAPKRRMPILVGVVAVLVLVVAAGVWQFYMRRPSVEPASVDKMAFPLPDKPSIAVLPFDNMSDDPKQEYFSDGMTEEIITALSKVPYLFVIARNSTFSYKGKPVKIRQVAEELGVRYVLEGSVRKVEDKVRVTAQLIDAIKGHHLWAERYERELKDTFALQDEITGNILSALAVKLTRGEQATIRHKGSDNLEAHLKYLQARWYYYRMTKEGLFRSRQLAEEVMALDPEYASAYLILGYLHIREVFYGWSKSRKESLEQALELAQKAIFLDESNPYGYLLLCSVYMFKKQYEKAIAEAERAIALDPNDAGAYSQLGAVLHMVGRRQEAIAPLEKAIRINPMAPSYYFRRLGAVYRDIGRYEEAIVQLKKAINLLPDSLYPHIGLAATYSLAGRDEEARAEVSEVLRIQPKISLKSLAKRVAYKNKADIDRLIDALRKAGLPETPPLPLPDKPSIAVLPFENRSDDPKQEYFADGITDDLITDLSKISGVFVIASNSVFTYNGKPVKVQQVARELGVRYVLEGSVRRAADQIRINAQLIDATTGHHLWAERFDGKLKDLFALQDGFTQKIVAALAVELTANDASLLARKYTDNVAANEAYWQGWDHQRRNTRDDIVKAVEYLKKAIELDPDFTQAHARLASAYQHSVRRNWDVGLGRKETRSLARKHLKIAMGNPTPLALGTSAMSRVFRRQYEEAIDEAERAIALDPNDADNHFRMGYVLTYAGRSAEATDFFKTAMRLNPHYPGWYTLFLGVAQYCLEQYNEAAASEERALKLDPNASPWLLAAAYAQLGREEEAADVLAKYIEKRGWHLPYVESTFRYWPFKNQRDLDRFAEGLVKAGLPRPNNPAYRRKYPEAIAQAERALTAAPNDAKAHRMMAESLIFAGRSTEALDFIKKAISLEPDYSWYLYTLGLGQFCLEQYEDAATTLEKFSNEHKADSAGWLLAATYAHLGRQQKAEDMLTKHMKSSGYKGQTVSRVLKFYLHAFKDPKDTERFAEGLHKAGLPME